MKQFLISDPEGYNIWDLINLEEYDNTLDTLTILGDLLDSTQAFPEFSESEFLEKKSFNLRNMQEINKKTNVNLIFGNRDLNKIKCLVLNKLKNVEQSQNKNNFNNGNIVLSLEKYEELKREILVNSENMWFAKLSNWYTFWNPMVGTKKQWNIDPNYLATPFLTRFYEIFGIDNAPNDGGTMSAKNLLKTIPYEIGVVNNNDDYNAFIVLAIFNSLLSNKFMHGSLDIDLTITNKKESSDLNSNFCNGWLRKIYLDEKNNVCDFIISENAKKVLLLSHGGITKNILEQSHKLKIFKKKLINNNKLTNILTDAKLFWEQQIGGYYEKDGSDTQFNLGSVIMRTKIINKEFKISIQECLIENIFTEKPSFNMLFLLIMSSPFDCVSFNGKIKESDIKPNCDDIISSGRLSPIMAGYEIMRTEFFYVEDYDVYQIYGHMPVGYGTTIDMFEKNELKSFLINMDSSNSFTGSSVNTGDSKSYLKLNLESLPNEICVISVIKHNLRQDLYNDTEIDYYNTQIENKGINFVVETINDENIDIHINNNICDTQFLDLLRKSKNYNFHGYVDDKIVFTINSTHAKFNKILFYIDNKKLDNDGNFVKTANLIGGDMYGGKYLKYKKKYLKLKNKYK